MNDLEKARQLLLDKSVKLIDVSKEYISDLTLFVSP